LYSKLMLTLRFFCGGDALTRSCDLSRAKEARLTLSFIFVI
jgi:hypothetical protein